MYEMVGVLGRAAIYPFRFISPSASRSLDGALQQIYNVLPYGLWHALFSILSRRLTCRVRFTLPVHEIRATSQLSIGTSSNINTAR